MSNFYKDAMNIPIVGAEYGFNGVVDPEYARGHRDALVAASKIALDADAKIDGLETDLAEAQAEITRLREGGCAREQGATQWCAEAQRLAETVEKARELLLQAHEPDQGQLRAQWDKDVDEWLIHSLIATDLLTRRKTYTQMNIQEALRRTSARISVGSRWLIREEDGTYIVYEHRYGRKKSTVIIETHDEEEAVSMLLEEEAEK